MIGHRGLKVHSGVGPVIQADDTRPGRGNRVGECVRGERDFSRGIGRTEDEQLVTCLPPSAADVGHGLLAATAARGDGARLQIVEHPEHRPEHRPATGATGRGLAPLAIAPHALRSCIQEAVSAAVAPMAVLPSVSRTVAQAGKGQGFAESELRVKLKARRARR